MSREIEFATGLFIQFDYYLYNCLAGLMSYNKLKFSRRRKLNKSVRKTLKKFKRWNASCPENHEHNIHLLLGAVAYKDEDYDTAFLMFEKGSRLAEKNNFLNKQVLAQKLKLATAHYMSTDILTKTAEELKVLDKAWKA